MAVKTEEAKAEFKHPRKQFPAQSSTQDLLAKRHKFHLMVGINTRIRRHLLCHLTNNGQLTELQRVISAAGGPCGAPRMNKNSRSHRDHAFVTTEAPVLLEVRIEGRVKREKWVPCPPNAAPSSPNQQGLRARGVLDDPWHKKHFSIPSLIPWNSHFTT